MGLVASKDSLSKKRIDECTSNTSLSNIRYVTTEKPKWKVFTKREVRAIPAYQSGVRGCPCGNNAPCKQRVTPRGVTLHYPQKAKKRRFGKFGSPLSKSSKPILGKNNRLTKQLSMTLNKTKWLPTWRLDKIIYNSPFKTLSDYKLKHRLRKIRSKTSIFEKPWTKHRISKKYSGLWDFFHNCHCIYSRFHRAAKLKRRNGSL